MSTENATTQADGLNDEELEQVAGGSNAGGPLVTTPPICPDDDFVIIDDPYVSGPELFS